MDFVNTFHPKKLILLIINGLQNRLLKPGISSGAQKSASARIFKNGRKIKVSQKRLFS
ncbi:MAG: hypothetical protein ACI350_07110 [Prevotella sp.]